jgi:hypothetical protein
MLGSIENEVRPAQAPAARGSSARLNSSSAHDSGAAIAGIVGIYSDPKHVILYASNCEARQEFSVVLTAGQPTPSSESSEVRWMGVSETLEYTMDVSMRIRIDDYLAHSGPPAVR